MAVNLQYLVVPRFLAGLTMVPCLCALFTLVGMMGCYFVGVVLLRIDEGIFHGADEVAGRSRRSDQRHDQGGGVWRRPHDGGCC
ncbi:MAG: ABC transporter permease [bacterium]